MLALQKQSRKGIEKVFTTILTVKKVKDNVQLLMELHLTATQCHLTYGISRIT